MRCAFVIRVCLLGGDAVAIASHQVATANTYAQMFSNLPSCGKPTRLLVYDLHTLQAREKESGERERWYERREGKRERQEAGGKMKREWEKLIVERTLFGIGSTEEGEGEMHRDAQRWREREEISLRECQEAAQPMRPVSLLLRACCRAEYDGLDCCC